MSETRDIRLKRLKMRSMRRGIKEMDLLLIAYSETRLGALSDVQLDTYEAMLEENDQDLYAWVSGKDAPPRHLADVLADVRAVYEDKVAGR